MRERWNWICEAIGSALEFLLSPLFAPLRFVRLPWLQRPTTRELTTAATTSSRSSESSDRREAAAMAEIPKSSAEANYEYFQRLFIQSRNLLQKAVEKDENRLNTKRDVLTHYRKALRDLQLALNVDPNKCTAAMRPKVEQSRAVLQKHLALVQGRIDDLETYLRIKPTSVASSANSAVQPSTSAASRPTTRSTAANGGRAALLRSVNPKYAEELLSTVVETTDVRMADILGNWDAKQALEEAVILPTLNPKLFSGLRQPAKGILLFGPPGNGKTMLAKATANEAGCTFFNISAATIMSKWVGEGEKMMQTLFQMARNAQPSIIFIDELDSMLSERTENENGASRRVKTEFLLQFDGCTTKSEDRVLVLGATNRPQELDDGVLRRFPRRIYIDLPDVDARADLIKRNFEHTNTPFTLSASQLHSIAAQCSGFSYSDLTALCREASMAPLRELTRSQLQHASSAQVRPVNLRDLQAATAVIRPSCNVENVKKLRDFARSFAQSR
ncbi:AAA domain-containing protein [Aphelenchoides fujianensis]|nr:AAA domain-containing protein [Aphelenchoides fujianensis]